jgi:hypothetical protein
MVIAAAMGMRGNHVYKIYIEGVSFGPEPIVDVVSVSRAADYHCGPDLAYSQPLDIVLVPKTDLPVHFNESAKTVNCP